MRWNEQRKERARACASVVLPTPGTSSISRCPRASSVVRASWMTSSLPFTTRVIARRSSARRVLALLVVVCNSRGLLLQKQVAAASLNGHAGCGYNRDGLSQFFGEFVSAPEVPHSVGD